MQAQWLMQSGRRMQARFKRYQAISKPKLALKAKPKLKRKRRSDGVASDTKPKVRRTGGAFRAFVRQKLLGDGTKKSFKHKMGAIAAEYRALPAAKRAALKRTGKAATIAGRAK